MIALQIHFTYELPRSEYEALCQHAAPAIATAPGLVWKMFLIDETRGAACGQYLFTTGDAAEAYLRGPVITQLRAHPAIRGVTVNRFEVQEAPSAITRAPLAWVGEPVAGQGRPVR